MVLHACLALTIALYSPEALSHQNGGRGGNGDRGGERSGRGGWGNQSWFNKENYRQLNQFDEKFQSEKQTATEPARNQEDEARGTGKETKSAQKDSLRQSNQQAAPPQDTYSERASQNYRAAAVATRTLGLIASAEGLFNVIRNDIRIGEDVQKEGAPHTAAGDTLIATGLRSLEAGEKLGALGHRDNEGSVTELEPEIMNDPLSRELMASLAQMTGHSESELVDRILDSKGEVEILSKHFPAVAKRKAEILAALNSDGEIVLSGSTFETIRGRINFERLRNALMQNSLANRPQPALLATSAVARIPYQSFYSAAARPSPATKDRPQESPLSAIAKARTPASVSEFPGIGENLPSFDLEFSQAELSERSLFEKVRRKYLEIAPTLTGENKNPGR